LVLLPLVVILVVAGEAVSVLLLVLLLLLLLLLGVVVLAGVAEHTLTTVFPRSTAQFMMCGANCAPSCL
jgi:hypothetical protein